VTSSIADLERRLAVVERRLAVLEGDADIVQDYNREAAAPRLGDGFAANASKQAGHVLLIFGGAYLLRAITDYEFVPIAVGLLMGAVYAVFWLFLAYRRGQTESRRTDAAFYGGTSIVLTLPLLHEATTKFALLSGTQSVVALLVYCLLVMGVAVAHNQKVLAWMVTAGGIATATASLVVSHDAASVAVFLLILGLASLLAEYRTQWLGLRWLGAIGANSGVLAIVALSQAEHWTIDPRLPFVFAVILLAMYLTSFTYYSHVRDQLLGIFEAVQALVAVGIVIAAASMAVQGGQLGIATAGALSLLLGLGGYALATTKGTRELRYRNFFYYSTLGLVFVVAGTGLLFPLVWAALIWAAMAMLMAWFSGRTGWVSLSLQCTFLLLASGVGSGLLVTGLRALVGDPNSGGWPVLMYSQVGVAAATVACLFIPVAQKSERWGVLAGLPQLLVLALSVWEVGGLVVAYGSSLLTVADGTEINRAALAALRTAVLSAASVTLALSSRYRRWPEARWLVYPVLVLVGTKLFVEDFPHGQPASLFVSLAFVGTALLLVAPLLKREDSPADIS
jgi:hypothetical protein